MLCHLEQSPAILPKEALKASPQTAAEDFHAGPNNSATSMGS